MNRHQERTERFLGNDLNGSTLPVERLRRRDSDDHFVMVEFGHDSVPIAYSQAPFTGERAYIGVETWLRDPSGRKRERLADNHDRYTDQNIFYITHELGGEVKRVHESGEGATSWYDGEFNTETVLPPAIAREVFASNVFGDPYIAHSPERTEALLSEMVRVTEPGGAIVLRETITPQYERHITPQLLTRLGIDEMTLIRHGIEDESLWRELEGHYRGAPRLYVDSDAAAGAFYMILRKDGSIESPETMLTVAERDSTLGIAVNPEQPAPPEVLRELTTLKVPYIDFTGTDRSGMIEVNKSVVQDVADFFHVAYLTKFPIGRVGRSSDEQYAWDDDKLMATNTTSGFNYRTIKDTQTPSLHARGLAFDVNPNLNPYIIFDKQGGLAAVYPKNATYDPERPGTLSHDHPLVVFMRGRGWIWGGDWQQGRIDYQHFEKPYQKA